jgi:hypothetical protein
MSLVKGVVSGQTGQAAFYEKTIGQSLRFNDNDSAYLSRTPASAGDRQKWTWSGWIKRGNIPNNTTQYVLLGSASASTGGDAIMISDTEKFQVNLGLVGNSAGVVTSQVFRDASSWYHVVAEVDTTQATAVNRIKIYVNGVQVTEFTSTNYPAQNFNCQINNNQAQYISRHGYAPYNGYWDGYLAEVHFTDGTAYTADAFGEFKSGIWIPKDPSVTYGTNGFHLDFSDVTLSGTAITTVNDTSLNSNNFTAYNLSDYDIVPDSPTNNFATFNPLHSAATMHKLEGNLEVAAPGTNWYTALVTQGIDSGKWYAEFYYERLGAGLAFVGVAKIAQPQTINAYLGESAIADPDSYGYYSSTGNLFNNGGNSAYGDSYADGDIIGLALDMDAGNLYFYKNGTIQNSGTAAATGLTGTMYIGATSYSTSDHIYLNTGQDSTFAGNETPAGTNTDANGNGAFQHTVPSGYLALCTASTPDPSIDPAADAQPADHFNAYVYYGNGGGQMVGDLVREVPDTVAISYSLRGNSESSNQTLSKTDLSITPTDNNKWTFSGWYKRGGNALGVLQNIFGARNIGTHYTRILFDTNNKIAFQSAQSGTLRWNLITTETFEDTTRWYHIVINADTDQVTDSDRLAIYVDGRKIELFDTSSWPTLGRNSYINDGSIGHYFSELAGVYPFDGYIANTHFVDGSALAADSFGAFDGDGVWSPITPSVTYGVNGFNLDFSNTADYGEDQSVNGNDFTASNYATSDQFEDTPTNNFATLNKGRSPAHITTLMANTVFRTSTAGWETIASDTYVDYGKWYAELKVADDGRQFIGVVLESSDATDIPDVYQRIGLWNFYYNGDLYNDGGFYVNVGVTFTTDDILMIAMDVDEGVAWVGKNGTWINSGDPAAGTNPLIPGNSTPQGTGSFRRKLVTFSGSCYYTASRSRWNFGNDATFGGDSTLPGTVYADDNGIGEFTYDVPTGFLCLCENNITNHGPDEKPDFVWIKSRTATDSHQLYDSVRGIGNRLQSDGNQVEDSRPDSVLEFNANGFIVGSDDKVNDYGDSYASWTWKAGGSAVTNTAGTITSQVSANTDAGFSIVSYDGTQVAGDNVGHGLSQTPEMIIVKKRGSAAANWECLS